MFALEDYDKNVTIRVCENVAQNVAQPIFCPN
jgi:hypothetical protein